MFAVASRVLAVLAVFGIVALLVAAPWRSGGVSRALDAEVSPGALTAADGALLPEGDGFKPVPQFDTAGPHDLVRYEMPEPQARPPLPAGATELTWSDLWRDGAYEPPAVNGFRLGTPEANLFPDGTTAQDIELFFLDLSDMRSLQPMVGAIREDLDGTRVRLAGYTTPVGFGETETDFLLVPELGACIHVPPPPPNQIVYVPRAEGAPAMFEPVWVTGTLRAGPLATVLADVGYRLEDAVAEPYR